MTCWKNYYTTYFISSDSFVSLFWKNSASHNLRIKFCILDLISVLLRLDVGVDFKPRKRTLVWYLDNVLLDKWKHFCMKICFLAFFSSSLFDISFVVAFALFSFHFLLWYYLFFLYNLSNFFLFSVDFTIFMFMFIITRLCWNGLLSKNNSFYHYLVFQELLQFLCSMFCDLPRLKRLWLYL